MNYIDYIQRDSKKNIPHFVWDGLFFVSLRKTNLTPNKMKRIQTWLLGALVSLIGTAYAHAAAEDFSGKTLSSGAIAATLETGKWYFLYNEKTGTYAKEGDGYALGVTDVAPNGLDAEANAGYLVQLEPASEEGRYYIKSGLGHYYRNVTTAKNNGTEDTIRANSKYAIAAFGSEGHWYLQSNGLYYLQSKSGNLVGASGKGTAGGDRDWTFVEVVMKSTADLTGEDYVNYVLAKGGLVRFSNRRMPGRNLACTKTAVLGAASTLDDLSQVWILGRSGDAYTLRNGGTGLFLEGDDNFRVPASAPKPIYIQMSPNNSNGSSYVNLSGSSDFGGKSCLNLNGDGSTLYEWYCEGDQGSDWTISLVDNFTLQEVEDNLLANSRFREPVAGKYYRICNIAYDLYVNEDFSANALGCEPANDEKLSQYWTLVPTGVQGQFHLKNMCTERLVTRQNGSLSTTYKTQSGAPAAGFTLTRTDDVTDMKYFIIDNGSVGLHCDAGRNVVGWYSQGIPASTWGFEEVTLTDEFIEEGRASLGNYTTLKANITKYKAALANLFEDAACTRLKAAIQALSDEQLAQDADYLTLNADMQAMVLKVKNDSWQVCTGDDGYSRGFEKFFRVRDDYKVYSHFQKMSSNQYCGMSNCFGKLSGPTGITGKSGDIIYIYVDQEPSADCTLQVEVIGDSDSPGDHQTGATTTLHQGLNAILLGDRSTIYIFYQLEDPEKFLADYPDMKIHIEGGEVQGYWDATRGMTNADWRLLRERLLDKSEVLNLKTERLVFAMNNRLVQDAVGPANEMEGLMRVWNTLLQNEEDLMGFQEDMKGRFNNVWNCFSMNHSYMYATSFGTYYSDGTLPTVMNYKSMTETGGGATWGPSHEMGHNHQNSICAVGTMEVSNNLFSNVNVFLHGVSTSRGEALANTFAEFAKGTPWVSRNIWAQTQMYYQLYLYYHVLGNKPDFYPTLFRMLRKDPIEKGPWDGSLSTDSDGDGVTDIVGGFRSSGKDDYLKMARMMCDAAGEDLSELFEAYGMFVPVSDYWIGDYSNYWMTTTQEDIDEAKAYMRRYPKARSIVFIEDRIKPSPSIQGGVLEGKPASETRVAISNEGCNLIGANGDVGQYGDYTKEYVTTGYYYTSSYSQGTNSYRVEGSGAVGFKVYDNAGNLVYLSNRKTITFPKEVQQKVADGFTIVACEPNGYEVLVPNAPALYRGEMTVYYEGSDTPHTVYYYGTGSAGKSAVSPLPANSVAYILPGQSAKKQPTAELLQQANVVAPDGVAAQFVMDGDKPCFIPDGFQASSLSFSKDGVGYQALCLPFDVWEGFEGTLDGANLVPEIETVTAGSPVVVNGPFSATLTDVTVNAGRFGLADSGYVLDATGKSVVYAEGISPFTYIFDGPMDIETAIRTCTSSAGEDDREELYDLSGRRVARAGKGGIYLMRGKKIVK